MGIKLEDFEQPSSSPSSEITKSSPIEGQKVAPQKQIRGDRWSEMPQSELLEQRNLLSQRLTTCLEMGRTDLAMQIQPWIEYLDNLLNQK